MKRTCTVEGNMRSTREHPLTYITPVEMRDYFSPLCSCWTSVLTGINSCHISHKKLKDSFVQIRYQEWGAEFTWIFVILRNAKSNLHKIRKTQGKFVFGFYLPQQISSRDEHICLRIIFQSHFRDKANSLRSVCYFKIM